MTKTVTSLFHSEHHAAAARSRLEQAGIPKGGIDIWSTPHNLAAVLEDAGVSYSDAHAYAEGVRRGGSAVIVSCDDDEVDRVVSILDQEGVMDLDEQQASWRSTGWQGQEASASGLGATAARSAGLDTGKDITGSPDITEARTDGAPAEASQGRVRVHPRLVERPVRK